jgi:Putative auto-transporter adhesin, head GIN domain
MEKRAAQVTGVRVFVVLGLLLGCLGAGRGITGSGKALRQPRTVADFRRIELRGSADVKVTVGDKTDVVVVGDDNIVPHLRTVVEKGALVIEFESGSYSSKLPLEVVVKTPLLEGVKLAGSGDVKVDNLAGERFEAHIAGSGNIGGAGKVRELDVSISGSGDVHLFGVGSDRARVRIAGSGNAEIDVRESLEARVSGSGDVRYKGSPKTDVSIAGSGSVKPS